MSSSFPPESRLPADQKPRTRGHTPSRNEVMGQLHRILSDPLFQKSNQLSSFLRFAVASTVEGQSHQLKEYVIGVEILKRGDTFNPREDPCVRVVAGRVRSKLAEYYQGPGQSDPVRIDLPRGGYIPVFEHRPGVMTAEADPAAHADGQKGRHSSAERPENRKRHVVGIGLVCSMALAGIGAWWSFSRTGVAPRQTLTPVPLTSYPGMEAQPTFAPNGNYVAFTWDGEKRDNSDIYVQQLGRDRPI